MHHHHTGQYTVILESGSTVEVIGRHLSYTEAHDLVTSVHGFNHSAYLVEES